MCLIVLAVRQHPDYPLIILANRDEFYQRPTAPLHRWAESPEVWAGKDLQHGGTWACWHATGRFAALTNIRRPGAMYDGKRSRGELPLEFLRQQGDPEEFAHSLSGMADEFAPFNLLYGTSEQLYYSTSDALDPIPIEEGIHGLSNASLDVPWPKVEHVRGQLGSCLSKAGPITTEALFDCMLRVDAFPDEQLPETGVPLAWERILSSPFIVSEEYGTRSTLLIRVGRDRQLTLSERTYQPHCGPALFHERTFVLER